MFGCSMVDASWYISPLLRRFHSNSSIISILALVTEEVSGKLIHRGDYFDRSLSPINHSTLEIVFLYVNYFNDCTKIFLSDSESSPFTPHQFNERITRDGNRFRYRSTSVPNLTAVKEKV
jgi:hypothetical protein